MQTSVRKGHGRNHGAPEVCGEKGCSEEYVNTNSLLHFSIIQSWSGIKLSEMIKSLSFYDFVCMVMLSFLYLYGVTVIKTDVVTNECTKQLKLIPCLDKNKIITKLINLLKSYCIRFGVKCRVP
jgi:hypothetical protein